MTPPIYVNISSRHLKPEDLEFLALQNLQPELYFPADFIDQATPPQMETLAKDLAGRQFKPILHAPFYDLNIGARDSRIQEASLDRLRWSLENAKQLGAPQVVVHPGHGPWVLTKNFGAWLDRAREPLQRLVSLAKDLGLKLAFENIYDTDPHDLVELAAAVPGEHVGFCFDVGHFNVFSQTSIRTWLETLGPRIFELHLHDNFGAEDDHIAVGDGSVKFGPIIQWIHGREKPPFLTLEMEQKTHVIKSVGRIREWFEAAGDAAKG